MEFECLSKVGERLGLRLSLASDIDLEALSDEPPTLLGNNGRKTA